MGSVINDILAMDVCEGFETLFTTKWEDFKLTLETSSGVDSNAQSLTQEVAAAPSRYILLHIMLDFLWSVPANQITGMSVVTYEHLEWIVEIKNWVLTSKDEMQIDPNNLQISMRAWLEARIDQYAALTNAKTNVATDLEDWIGTYGGNGDLLTKYYFALSLEQNRGPCGGPETSEDKALKQLLAADFSEETIENNPTNGNNYTLTINSIFSDNGVTPPTQQVIDDLFVEVTEELPALFIPCPSHQCWRFDSTSGQCVLRDDAGCLTLGCSWDKVKIGFISKSLSNLEDTSVDPFGTGACAPKFNSTTKMWEVDIPHGNCDMEIKSSYDDTKLEFKVQIGFGGTPNLQMLDFNSNTMIDVRRDPSLGNAILEFTCAYEKKIEVSSDSFNILAASAQDSNYNTAGSLTSG